MAVAAVWLLQIGQTMHRKALLWRDKIAVSPTFPWFESSLNNHKSVYVYTKQVPTSLSIARAASVSVS